MRTIRSVLTSLARSPLKSGVTLTTVGLGIGVLILALSISSAFSRLLAEQLAGEGLIVMVANVRTAADGSLEPVKPPQFDAEATAALLDGVTGAVAASSRSPSPPGPSSWWTGTGTSCGPCTVSARSISR